MYNVYKIKYNHQNWDQIIILVQIFQSVNSSVDEFVATTYVGSALLASNVATVLLAHKVTKPSFKGWFSRS